LPDALPSNISDKKLIQGPVSNGMALLWSSVIAYGQQAMMRSRSTLEADGSVRLMLQRGISWVPEIPCEF
jgi:hypothetical protein